LLQQSTYAIGTLTPTRLAAARPTTVHVNRMLQALRRKNLITLR
jgi:hypothetical protein